MSNWICRKRRNNVSPGSAHTYVHQNDCLFGGLRTGLNFHRNWEWYVEYAEYEECAEYVEPMSVLHPFRSDECDYETLHLNRIKPDNLPAAQSHPRRLWKYSKTTSKYADFGKNMQISQNMQNMQNMQNHRYWPLFPSRLKQELKNWQRRCPRRGRELFRGVSQPHWRFIAFKIFVFENECKSAYFRPKYAEICRICRNMQNMQNMQIGICSNPFQDRYLYQKFFPSRRAILGATELLWKRGFSWKSSAGFRRGHPQWSFLIDILVVSNFRSSIFSSSTSPILTDYGMPQL